MRANLSHSAIQPPYEIAGYTLHECVGQGGMGYVFRATRSDGQPAAVKFSNNTPRFQREYSQLHSMSHPRIVRVFECGETRGPYSYLIMEYIDGTTLKEAMKLSGGRLALESFYKVFAQVTAALAYIHARDAIHRDIKPANIMIYNRITPGGQLSVKVMDFGLVKSLDDTSLLTRADSILGTSAYMAPEQILNPSQVTPSADLYALGVTMYEVLTGRLPFNGGGSTVREQHLNDAPVPPSQIIGGIPPGLEQLIMQLMEKDAEKRPASAQEVQAALCAIAGTSFCQFCGALIPSEGSAPCPDCQRVPPQMRPGRLIHERYRVVMMIGEGGFGTAYRAVDIRTQQACVLKVCRLITETARRQFQKEGELLGGLQHPNLPSLIDQFPLDEKDPDGPEQVIVMSFAGQTNLEQVRQRGQVPVERVLRWADQLCDVLTFLHEQPQPVLHRDIKPANIILTGDDCPMLIDFGIAKEYEPGERTTTAAMGISPGYSPPEQYVTRLAKANKPAHPPAVPIAADTTASSAYTSIDRERTNLKTQPTLSSSRQMSPANRSAGGSSANSAIDSTSETDPRSDIYSLGATLFALLTGEVPPECIDLQINQKKPPRIRRSNPNVPRPVGDAIYKAMQFAKADRFQRAAEFKAALHDPNFSYRTSSTTLTTSSVAATREKKPPIWLFMLYGAVILAVLAVLIFVILDPVQLTGSRVDPLRTTFPQTQTAQAIAAVATSDALEITLARAQNVQTQMALAQLATQQMATQTAQAGDMVTQQAQTEAAVIAMALTNQPTITPTITLTNTPTITPMATGTNRPSSTPLPLPTNTPNIPTRVVIVQPGSPRLLSPASSASFTAGEAVTLNWSSDSNASEYWLEYQGSASGNSGWTSANYYSANLPAGSYTWRVKARNSSGEGGWSDTWSFTIQQPAPGSPDLGGPTNGATVMPNSAFTFSWAAASGASDYLLEYSGTASGNSGWISATGWSTSLPSGNYSWHVKARNAGGESPWSYAWSLTVFTPPADIVIVPRLPGFTWDGVSRSGIAAQNPISCSANPDLTQSIYYRTNDSTAWAKWTPTIDVAGYYRIYVFIPKYEHTAPITTQARYELNTPSGGRNTIATLDQNNNKCNWVDIGRYYLDAGSGNFLYMPALTSESGTFHLIASDGAKFVWAP